MPEHSWQKSVSKAFFSLSIEKKKRKRGSAFTEQLRASEGLGVLFFSPSKVVRARELAAAREFAKDDEALG